MSRGGEISERERYFKYIVLSRREYIARAALHSLDKSFPFAASDF